MKYFTSSSELDGWTLNFSISSYKRDVDKWKKKSFKYYSSKVCKRLEIDNTP